MWSRDGKALFFLGADRKMITVAINSGSADKFDAGRTATGCLKAARGRPYDIFAVGKDGRFPDARSRGNGKQANLGHSMVDVLLKH